MTRTPTSRKTLAVAAATAAALALTLAPAAHAATWTTRTVTAQDLPAGTAVAGADAGPSPYAPAYPNQLLSNPDPDGNVWMFNGGTLIIKYTEGASDTAYTWTNYRYKITAVHTDAYGTVWAAGFDNQTHRYIVGSLYPYTANGQTSLLWRTAFEFDSWTASYESSYAGSAMRIQSWVADAAGSTFWLSTGRGVYRINLADPAAGTVRSADVWLNDPSGAATAAPPLALASDGSVWTAGGYMLDPATGSWTDPITGTTSRYPTGPGATFDPSGTVLWWVDLDKKIYSLDTVRHVRTEYDLPGTVAYVGSNAGIAVNPVNGTVFVDFVGDGTGARVGTLIPDTGEFTTWKAATYGQGPLTFWRDGTPVYTPGVGLSMFQQGSAVDQATVAAGSSTTVDVTANDQLFHPVGQITIPASFQPSHGTVVVTADNQVVYTPDFGYSGTDSFRYNVTTSAGLTTNASVDVTVQDPPAAAPVANPDATSTDWDKPVTVPILDNDTADLATATVKVVADPSHGTAEVVGNQIVYTPGDPTAAADTLRYELTDKNGTSDPATVAITLAPKPPAPVANPDATSTDWDKPVTVPVLDNDTADLATATVKVVADPSHGTAEVVGNQIVYTPGDPTAAADTLRYELTDKNGTSDPATVAITLAPKPPAPVANPDATSTDWDKPVTVPVLDNDTADLATATVKVVADPSHGTAEVVGNQIVYTPGDPTAAADTLRYELTDKNGTSDPATVAITLAPKPPAPVPDARDDDAKTAAASPVTVPVLANDTYDAATAIVTIVTAPEHGTAEVVDNQVVYTPAGAFDGPDTVTYQLRDNGGTDTARMTVDVAPSPRAPDPKPDTSTTQPGRPVTVTVLANDTYDAATAIVTIVTAPEHGTAAVTGTNQILYTPVDGHVTQDTFTYQLTDKGGSRQTHVVIHVAKAPPPPTPPTVPPVPPTDTTTSPAPPVPPQQHHQADPQRPTRIDAGGPGLAAHLADRPATATSDTAGWKSPGWARGAGLAALLGALLAVPTGRIRRRP